MRLKRRLTDFQRPKLRALAMLLLPLLLVSCALMAGHETKPVDPACVLFKPIYLSKDDILTDDSAKQILAHNKAGADACGWKPRKKP